MKNVPCEQLVSPAPNERETSLEKPGALSRHLVKNSENSGSGLHEKRFFGSPDLKIPRKSGTAQKVVPFSRLERPDWFLAFQLHLPGNLYQFRPRPTVIDILQTKSNLSETALMTSELDINQTNANTGQV